MIDYDAKAERFENDVGLVFNVVIVLLTIFFLGTAIWNIV